MSKFNYFGFFETTGPQGKTRTLVSVHRTTLDWRTFETYDLKRHQWVASTHLMASAGSDHAYEPITEAEAAALTGEAALGAHRTRIKRARARE